MTKVNGKPPIERRSGVDRRKVDKGPPGGRERRLGMEPRKPEVVEIEMSSSEWAALSELPDDTPPSGRKSGS
jgi:hypothetical protein